MSEMYGGTLIAPPVNLRVWVVASIAITGVEVAKTTWKEQRKQRKENVPIKDYIVQII